MRQKYKTTGVMYIRENPDPKSSTKGTYNANTEFIAVNKKTLNNGSVWLQIENQSYWICQYGGQSKKTYAELIEDLEKPSGGDGETDPSPDTPSEGDKPTTATYKKYKVIVSGLIKRTDHVVGDETKTGEHFNYNEIVNVIETFEDDEGSLWGKVYYGEDPNINVSKSESNNTEQSKDPINTTIIGTLEILQECIMSASNTAESNGNINSSNDLGPAMCACEVGQKFDVISRQMDSSTGMTTYKINNGMYISASPDYVKYTPSNGVVEEPGSDPVIGTIKIKPNSYIYCRTKPSWDNSAKSKIVFNSSSEIYALERVKVANSATDMYRIKFGDNQSGYITANANYIIFTPTVTESETNPDDASTQSAMYSISTHADDGGDDKKDEKTETEVKIAGHIEILKDVNLRKSLSWSDDAISGKIAKKGDILNAVSDKIIVDDGGMYKLDNGLYVTTNADYTKYKTMNEFVWGCIYYKPTNEEEMVLYNESESDFTAPTVNVNSYYKVTATGVRKRKGPSESDSISGQFKFDEIIQVVDSKTDELGNIWVKTSDGVWGCYYYAETNEYYMEKLQDTSNIGNFKGVVIVSDLYMRSGHSTTDQTLGHFTKNQVLTCIEKYQDSTGSIWVKTSDGVWGCAVYVKGSSTEVYIQLSDSNGTFGADQIGRTDIDTARSDLNLSDGDGPMGNYKIPGMGTDYATDRSKRVVSIPTEEEWHNPHTIWPGRTFPRKVTMGSVTTYDYAIPIGAGNEDDKSVPKMLNIIHKELNFPFAYDRSDLGQLYHQQFNRFKLIYPDYMIKQLVPIIFITRPDLNLFEGKTITPNTQINNDPVISYLVKSCPQTMSSLTSTYVFGSAHKLNPILSNMCEGIDIVDESVDVFETGETFTGYKTAYAKSNVKSMSSNQITLKFREVFDLSITKLMQGWVRYESCVYRGELVPKSEYIWKKIIDYCCNVYYFLLDPDMETIRFWSKYYGAFPVNVSKSMFNGDMSLATSISTSEVSTTFQYYKKKDFDVTSLIEFNTDTGGVSSTYEKLYNENTGLSGKAWVNAPFIITKTENTGIGKSTIDVFKLKWRPGTTMVPSASVN